MNLFIFGAGASYGSDSDKKTLPPLAANLFNALASNYSDISNNPVVMSLAKEFSTDFEQGLLKLYNLQSNFWSILQRCMAHFFFQYGVSIPINFSNLYYQLAQEIRKRNSSVALATLNYERIMEHSFGQAQISLFCGPNTNNGKVELCLPHGCCHLFCDGVRGMSGGVFFDPRGVTTNGPIVAINDPKSFEQRLREEAFPPVMSYFEPSKMTTSGANFILEQRDRYAKLISEASKIAIIGIRVREHDSHIWVPLKATNAQIIYCSGSGAAVEYNNWRDGVLNRKNDIVLNGYWNDEFQNINTKML